MLFLSKLKARFPKRDSTVQSSDGNNAALSRVQATSVTRDHADSGSYMGENGQLAQEEEKEQDVEAAVGETHMFEKQFDVSPITGQALGLTQQAEESGGQTLPLVESKQGKSRNTHRELSAVEHDGAERDVAPAQACPAPKDLQHLSTTQADAAPPRQPFTCNSPDRPKPKYIFHEADSSEDDSIEHEINVNLDAVPSEAGMRLKQLKATVRKEAEENSGITCSLGANANRVDYNIIMDQARLDRIR